MLVAYPVVSRPIGQHIEYVSPHFFAAAVMTLYLLSTTFSPILSTHGTLFALMFTEYTLVMFVMQAIVFSPWFKPDATRWLIAPALAVFAAGLFLVPRASDFMLMLVVIGAVAAGAGILSPILTYWISAKAGSAQGWELGKQTAAASLGVTLGSAVGGLLFNVAVLPGASFVLTAGLAVLGFLLSLGMPHWLVLADSRAEIGAAAQQRAMRR